MPVLVPGEGKRLVGRPPGERQRPPRPRRPTVDEPTAQLRRLPPPIQPPSQPPSQRRTGKPVPRQRITPGRDTLRPGRHRQARSFRAVGAFILVIGAIGGVYLGVERAGGSGTGVSAGAASPPVLDATRQRALELAQLKAEQAAADAAAKAKKANDLAKRAAEEASRSRPRTTYPVPASCSEYDGNRAIGCALLLEASFGLDQMPCLDRLWTRESGWYHKARNSTSGAYGIPQALPGEKMAAFGEDWQTNPVPQIKWGLSYIKNRYQTPCGAWAHFQAKNWY